MYRNGLTLKCRNVMTTRESCKPVGVGRSERAITGPFISDEFELKHIKYFLKLNNVRCVSMIYLQNTLPFSNDV